MKLCNTAHSPADVGIFDRKSKPRQRYEEEFRRKKIKNTLSGSYYHIVN